MKKNIFFQNKVVMHVLYFLLKKLMEPPLSEKLKKRSGTPRNLRVVTEKRFGTNSRKRSRYVHVHVSKTKE
jgi:hypothetical protein